MKRYTSFSGLIFAIVLFCGCSSAHQLSKNGEAVDVISTFWKFSNGHDTPYIKLSEKAWYQDSIGITEIGMIMFIGTEHGDSIDLSTMGYRFTDLRKRWAYEYRRFSDTASIIKKYRITDSTKFSGGWLFVKPKQLAFDSLNILTDTLIGDIAYKRCMTRYTYDYNREIYEEINLLRCDQKNTHFQLNSLLSNKLGCPVVAIKNYPLSSPHTRLDREVKQISKVFPDSVKRVIAAWKRNVKQHPVE
jgi:hypothetical protein